MSNQIQIGGGIGAGNNTLANASPNALGSPFSPAAVNNEPAVEAVTQTENQGFSLRGRMLWIVICLASFAIGYVLNSMGTAAGEYSSLVGLNFFSTFMVKVFVTLGKFQLLFIAVGLYSFYKCFFPKMRKKFNTIPVALAISLVATLLLAFAGMMWSRGLAP
jgi:hypothetical protein